MQSCMKPSETTEMKMAGFFVNLSFVHRREGLLSFCILILFNHSVHRLCEEIFFLVRKLLLTGLKRDPKVHIFDSVSILNQNMVQP